MGSGARSTRRLRRAAVLLLGGATVVSAAWTARFSLLHWGSTTVEIEEPLPGDELLPEARHVLTRAITIDALPAEVWPWLAQLGQGRGGLYSYDWLENLVGCDIHSADRVLTEWQQLEVGNEVRLHPRSALTVTAVEPGEHLVLRPGPLRAPGGASVPEGFPFDYTWTFVLRRSPGRRTRLIVRERYEPLVGWAEPAVEALAVVSAVMGIKMLRGIKARAEAQRHTPSVARAPDAT
jgi:hypothetical protein